MDLVSLTLQRPSAKLRNPVKLNTRNLAETNLSGLCTVIFAPLRTNSHAGEIDVSASVRLWIVRDGGRGFQTDRQTETDTAYTTNDDWGKK